MRLIATAIKLKWTSAIKLSWPQLHDPSLVYYARLPNGLVCPDISIGLNRQVDIKTITKSNSVFYAKSNNSFLSIDFIFFCVIHLKLNQSLCCRVLGAIVIMYMCAHTQAKPVRKGYWPYWPLNFLLSAGARACATIQIEHPFEI